MPSKKRKEGLSGEHARLHPTDPSCHPPPPLFPSSPKYADILSPPGQQFYLLTLHCYTCPVENSHICHPLSLKNVQTFCHLPLTLSMRSIFKEVHIQAQFYYQLLKRDGCSMLALYCHKADFHQINK